MVIQVLVLVAFVLVLELSEVEGLLVEKQLEQVVALLVVVMDLRRVEELMEAVVVGSLELRQGQL